MASYTRFEHRHRFSVWAAARAAQRGFKGGSVDALTAALESCGVSVYLSTSESLDTSQRKFDRLHRQWCRRIMKHLSGCGVQDATFGRAAKLLAVYLKSMVVIGSGARSNLAKTAHPPVDRILLRELARADDIEHPNQRAWAQVNWTELGEKEYYTLISQLRSCLKRGEPMWHLERYWHPVR